MPRLADFQRQFPDISFKISTTANTVPNASAIADIEIINGDGDWQEQEAIRLTQENWIVVASPGFMHLNPINDLSQLAKVPKICTSGYHESWQDWLAHQGYQGKVSKVVAEFEHSLLAIHAAMNQLGVLLVRDFLVEDELQQGVLVQVGTWHMPSSGAHYMMVRASEKSHVNTFAQWLIQSL